MKLTDEQQSIIEHEGDLKVNAVAGSGKTTTILEYARVRPHASILYLAFNKSVKLEAEQKLAQLGITNVKVDTAHSLAFRYTVPRSNYKVRFDYKPYEIASILSIKSSPGDLSHLKIAFHVYRFVRFFCNSAALKVLELNYLETIQQVESLGFVTEYYEAIVHYTRLFLAKMHKGEIDITHDFYLKQFQLLNPLLPYDYILFDEGQDASPCMLQAFLNQSANKVIIGDQHQQIYGWRFAVNALQQVDFRSLNLSNSFRFNHEVALLAQSILQLKTEINLPHTCPINGIGSPSAIKTRATLARSNTTLLSKAIELLIQQKELKSLYFEGQLSSYTFSEDGGSIYDILNLYNGNRHLIKDSLIKTMPSFDHLKDYMDETDDTSLSSLIDLVEKYHKDIPFFISKVKACTLSENDRHKADMVFSTVHKAKGMEYDEVFLCDDFINEQQIIDLKGAIKAQEQSPEAVAEEINVLYVAATRAKSKLHIPLRLLPTGYYINDKKVVTTDMALSLKPKITRANSNKNRKWSRQEEAELRQLFIQGKSIKEIALLLGRSQSAINLRVQKMELWF